jgi:hypothetical protein
VWPLSTCVSHLFEAMSTTTNNSDWVQTVATNVGSVQILSAPLKSRKETGLRHPYQFKASLADVRTLIKSLRELSKGDPYTKMQYGASPTSKSTTYGIRFDIFMLGFKPGYCGTPLTGVTREEWDKCVEEVTTAVRAVLPDVPVYASQWNPNNKFQFRIETYIMYSELQ